jgi:hypothetical protein
MKKVRINTQRMSPTRGTDVQICSCFSVFFLQTSGSPVERVLPNVSKIQSQNLILNWNRLGGLTHKS